MKVMCPGCNGTGRRLGSHRGLDLRCHACQGTRVQAVTNHSQFQMNRHLRRAYMKVKRSGPVPLTLIKGETPCAS
jgi:DnaJ-class molecular chaperone